METAPAQITAVVVDDHPFFRDGITRGLARSMRIRVVGEAGGGREGLEVIRDTAPQVAVVDQQMPDLHGVEVARIVARDLPATRVLLLSAVTDSAVVFAALEAGAAGYLSKESSREEIVEAIIRVAAGGVVVPPELAAGLATEIRSRGAEATSQLTERELQVLRGFARGLSVPQVAAELFLGVNTVKTHAARLYEKLGTHDRAAAVAEGMRRRLVD